MQLHLETTAGRTSISAYSEQGIHIAGRWYSNHLLLTPERILEDRQPVPIASLTSQHLKPLLEEKPEVLILGTGKEVIFPDPKLYAELAADNIGLEVMNTEAACRTFNILLSEKRRVVAVLYPGVM
ncbi:MAG: hypothetical protein JXA04_11720 [Gammaproteobacteria bacterium]|nr:hypothetical protein [Gammaproteobacteria bacterium]